jgi:hypothetical protein
MLIKAISVIVNQTVLLLEKVTPVLRQRKVVGVAAPFRVLVSQLLLGSFVVIDDACMVPSKS